MGTDIHLWVETRKAEGEPWEKLGRVFDYEGFDPSKDADVLKTWGVKGQPDYEEYLSNPRYVDQPYSGRNYTLFGALADVRNGTGFAGVEIGQRVVPIAQPRGMPEDLSSEMQEIWKREGQHTPTWLMLQEVIDYDWDQPYRHVGVLSEEQYAELQAGKKPEDWSGGISGPGIVQLSAAAYDTLKAAGELPEQVRVQFGPQAGKMVDAEIYVQATWLDDGGLRGSIGENWFRVLGGLADGYDPKNTRLVFWFDS